MEIKVETPEQSTDTTVKTALSLADTSPEEAAVNIDRSRLFDVSPDTYKDLKPSLDKEALSIERTPAQVQPVTQQFIQQSAQHTALAQEDLEPMGWFESRVKYYKEQTIDIPEMNREINELRGRQVVDGEDSLTQGELERLNALNANVAEMNDASRGVPGIGDTEKFGVEVLSAAGDMVRSYTENLGVLAAGVGGGAAVGALAGSFVPGLGTAAGATAGAVKGTIAASTVIGFLDGYKQTRDSTYNELSLAVDKDGAPLNIPHERRALVSQGVGVISGLASGLAGKVLSSNNPFLKRFASPKMAAKLITGSAATMAKMEIIGGITKSIMAEGGEEALQEFVGIIGKNFAKMDESEASFQNALDTSVELAKQTFTAETFQQVGKAAAVGGATGGLISSVTSAPGYKGLKGRMEEVQKVSQKRAEVLQNQNVMLDLAKDIKGTKVQQHAPAEMSNFTKKVFSTLGIDENVWFTMENLREFSDSPEKAEAVRKAIDPKGDLTKMAQELNTPLEVNRSDVLQIVTQFPDITDIMRLSPDGESPVEAKNNARNFTEKLTQAAAKREEILASLGVDEEMTPEMQAQLKEAGELANDPNPYTDAYDYLDSRTFKENDIMSPDEAEKFTSAHLDARLAVAQSLKEDVDSDFQTIENRIFRDVDAKDIQTDMVRLDTEFKILEKFQDRTVNATTVEHKEKGFSPSAIDPRSLPEDLKEIYFGNEKLKKRKVFVPGGLSLEESAVMNGVESGAELLRILAETPSRTEVKTQRAQRQIELRNRINQTLKPARLSKRDAAFSNLTKIHTGEMDYLKTKAWSTTKRGIIKIASPVPTVEGLNQRANEMVTKMKVRDLNANRFKQAESVSQRTAMKNFLNGEFEQAFVNKEKAALNNELRKETIKAQEKVAKYEAFWKKIDTPNVQQELKDAGMSDVMNDYLSVYQLDGVTRGEAEQNSFNNWIMKQVDNGNFTPAVPTRLDKTQMSSKDLSLEQYQAITEMGQNILHEAKLKNKLLRSIEKRNEIKTAEKIAADIETHTKNHVDYDVNRAERKNAKYLSTTERWHEGLKTSASAVSSIKSIVSELDGHQLGGFFHEQIGAPIKDARTAKRAEIFDIESHDKKTIETFYGMDKFKKMFNDFKAVPEFADIATLGDGAGNIRKVDLLTLQAYMGDPEGREAIGNFVTRQGVKLTVEDVQLVLNRELDSNDAAFVQNFMVDRFKRFEKRSMDLHRKTTGIEPDMVKGVQVVHNDKVLPGGYFPIKRQMATDDVKANTYLESVRNTVKKFAGDSMTILGEGAEGILGTDESHFYAKMRAAEMTQQGRLKDRTGSTRPLDITFENVFDFTEEAVHDLAFREVGIDTLKILKNPLNVQNMKAVVGPKKFTALLNGVKDVVSKTTERESTLYGEEYSWLNGVIQKAHSLHAVKTIGLNLTSAAIQADSLSNLTLRVGPKSAIYLGKAAAKIAANLSNYAQYVKIAEDINPDIKFEKDGIDNAIVKSSYDFIPSGSRFFSKYNTKSGDFMIKMKELQQSAIDSSFALVRESDRFNKVLTTMAISEQFLNGDVDGYPKARVDAMSDAERAKSMRSVVQQAIDLSLTASAPEDKTAIEKNKVAGIFTRYWTDRRSRLNTTLAQVDKIRGNIKKGDNAKAAVNAVTLALAAGTSAAFVNIVRDKAGNIIDELKGIEDEDDVIDFGINQAWSFAKAPFDQTLDVIPLVDGIKYQTELDVQSDYRNVSTPIFGVASDIASGIVIMKEVLDMAMISVKKGKLPAPPKLDDTQRKFLLTNAGYIVGGAPTNGMNKALGALNSKEVKKGAAYLKEDIMDLNKQIKAFINAFGEEKDAEVFVQDLKDYQATLPQFNDDVSHLIPENAKGAIKNSLNAAWDTVNADTGAAGIYQFTEDRWLELMSLNPDLGLTENGRVAKDPAQQEKAMEWEMQDNTRGLMAYEIPVNVVNLAGAHKFGFDNFAAIYAAKDNEKLSKVLGDQAELPVLENFKTVKQVKDYLAKEAKKLNTNVEQ